LNIVSFPFCCDFLNVFYLQSGHGSKIIIKNKKEKENGGTSESPHNPGAFCLFAGLQAGHDRGDRPAGPGQVFERI